VEQAQGRVVIDPGGRFVLVVDEGTMMAPAGGLLDASGTVFAIEDVTARPGRATLDLQVSGAAEAVLSTLALPPVRLSDRTGLPADVVAGRVAGTARVSFPMQRDVPPDAIDWQATATVQDVESSTLVPGRTLAATVLDLAADRTEVAILGTAELDGVPVTGRFHQIISPDGDGSRVEGRVALTSEALETFGIVLPPGTVSGAGSGDLVLTLARDTAPAFSLTSDLSGLTLALPELGWRKAPGTEGRLRVEGRLGPVPQVSRLVLEASGLLAEGQVDLGAGGVFEALRLSRLRVGRWLDGPVTLASRGAGFVPAISVTGGALDLRRLPDTGPGSGQGGAAPMALA
jgi:hypothetical protein